MNFTIKYNVITDTERTSGVIIVKNCINQFDAKCKLDDYLKKKYSGFKKMEVISLEQDIATKFNSIFGENIF